jgi:hypothetical protein
LVSISRNKTKKRKFIKAVEVDFINALLKEGKEEQPFQLIRNKDLGFIGSVLGGDGFILGIRDAEKYLTDDKNKNVIKNYLVGRDLYTNPDLHATRKVIDFSRYELEEASSYIDVFQYVLENVKPHKISLKRASYSDRWWQFAERCLTLYNSISDKKKVLVKARISKTHAFVFVENDYVFADALVVINSDSYNSFCYLSSSIHELWAWHYCTTMKTDMNYGPSRVLDNFPFPGHVENDIILELNKIGEQYHEFRRQLMLNLQLGLTKTYNLFHTPKLTANNQQLIKANLQIPIVQAVKDIETLRQLHKQMDEAVLKDYGWGFGSAQPIILAHDFYEVDYLPENDRIRYTISPEARKEILKRLLELNHKIHAEEVAAGLWNKKAKGKSKKEKEIATKQKDEEQHELF